MGARFLAALRVGLRQRRLRTFFAVCGLVSVVGLAASSPASAYIYWTRSDQNWISRATLDGTEINEQFLPTLGAGEGVAAAGGYVYWANSANDAIGRATIAGDNINQAFISTPGAHIVAVAVGAGHIYWTWWSGVFPSLATGVGRANLDGSDVQQGFIASTDHLPVGGIAVGGSYVFWDRSGPSQRGNARRTRWPWARCSCVWRV